jgi:ketosteroid isomerase-like protein
MFQRLLLLLLLIVWVPSLFAQQPPPAQPPPVASEAEVVEEHIQRFYADYWKAWDEGDADGVAAHLAPDFVALTFADPQGVVRADREAAVANVRHFFAAVVDRETLWGRSLLSVVVRSQTEVIAAVRTDFSLREAGRETELSLEVLRKEPDGGWRLVRRWSEKGVFPASASPRAQLQ